MDLRNIDTWRKMLQATAESMDYIRLVPRGLAIAYGFMMWEVISWYMGLPNPSTQHAALVTTVIGASAGFFGLYVNSGNKDWTKGFTPWNKKCTTCDKKECECSTDSQKS